MTIKDNQTTCDLNLSLDEAKSILQALIYTHVSGDDLTVSLELEDLLAEYINSKRNESIRSVKK
jgi:hypothetical protein